MDIVIPVNPILTAHDRCDTRKCGAQAYVKVFIKFGDEIGHLMYCGHHFAASELALSAVALTVIDERHRLLEVAKLDVSA